MLATSSLNDLSNSKYTDLWVSHQEGIHPQQHQPSLKGSGQTNYLEKFNNSLRQRCSRLIKETLSSSKKFFNYEGAIRYFIQHYNEVLRI